MKQLTCKQRWAKAKNSRMDDLRKLWRAQCDGVEDLEDLEDLGNLYEYGLSFTYNAPDDAEEGYWIYLLSTGGPHEEVRFYASTPRSQPYKITFVLQDWFDGYEREVVGKDYELMRDLWRDWQECETVQHAYDVALAEME